ncbi:MAG: hypothetical protein L0213_02410, partial [Candidatus Dadabacteria bacterium]|nr:hypothetical protein [Candidatus Dadabacteria bacterium]
MSRVLILVIALAMVVPAGIALNNAPVTPDTSANEEFAIIYANTPTEIKGLHGKVNIVHDYGTFAMAKLSQEEKKALSGSFVVESVKDLTTFQFNNYKFDVLKETPPIPTSLKVDN